MLIATIEQRASESKDIFKELYVMARTYRMLECTAEYNSKGLAVKIPEQDTLN